MSTHLDLESPWFGHPWALTHGEYGIRMIHASERDAGRWSYKVPNDPQLYNLLLPGEMVEVQVDPSGLREPETLKFRSWKADVQLARRELSEKVVDVVGKRGLKEVGNCAVLFRDPRLAEILAQGSGKIPADVAGEFYVVKVKAVGD